MTPIHTPSVGSSSRRIVGIRQQCPADRQHLAFAAAQRTGHLLEALRQLREHRKNAVEAGPIAAHEHPDLEILAHRQAPEHRVFLRHVAETQTHTPLGRHARQVASGNRDRAAGRPQFAHDRFHKRRLARAVAAENSYDAARLGGKRYVKQNLTAAVAGRKAVNLEERRLRHG